MGTAADERFRYVEMARHSRHLKRTLSSADFERFSLLIEGESEVRVELEFAFDDESRVRVSGRVDTQVKLPCQRCLRPVDLSIAENFDLQVNAEGVLDTDKTPILVDGPELTLGDIVEDELILGVPERVCTPDQCPHLPVLEYVDARAPDTHRAETESAFAVLDGLKRQLKSRQNKE
ncbi:MAG: YceD family protein [Proteobacteria bacterium]|nr:YceD family protein [Pseudomonadota bacterium]